MAVFLQDGTPLLLQDGSELLLQSENLVVVGPSNQTVRDHQIVTFEVVAVNASGAVSYQWYEDTILMPSETSSTLSFEVAYGTHNGSVYYCDVTDSNGTVSSANATLTVTQQALVWLTEPQDTLVVENTAASFSATADGEPTITYQWYETTAGLLTGETGTTLNLTPVLADSGNSYYCIATDGYGVTWQSGSGALTVVEEAGLGDQDIRIKTPSGQWVKIVNPIIREYVISANSTRTPSSADQAGAQRLVCVNTTAITITLTGFAIGDTVTVIRSNALVTVTTGDAVLINGQASQQLPSQWDVAQLVLTAVGWVAI